MMPEAHKPERENHSGVSRALHQAYGSGDHVGADAADADFAALLAKLDDPPPPYQQKGN